ncbi:unnamed protein product [Symbiodinium microadriaticum]|nr:unnamed protein product [Symbiodinium microadriaticum]
MCKDVNMHKLNLDMDMYNRFRDEASSLQSVAKNAVVDLFTGNSKWAMSYRALASGATDSAMYLASAGARSVAGADMASNIIMFAIFTSVDIYRYCSGEPGMVWDVLCDNIKENACGCGVGILGGVVGGMIGTLVCPGIGTFLGSLFAGMLFDFMGRASYRYALPKTKQREMEAKAKAILKQNAEICRVDVNKDSFKQAKSSFHFRLRQVHIDKHRNVDEETALRLHEECVQLVSAWGIVRKYYEDQDMIPENEPEGFVDVWTHRMRTSVDDAWVLMRSWINVRTDSTEENNDDLNDYQVMRVHC